MVGKFFFISLATLLLASAYATSPTCTASYTCKTSSQLFASDTCSYFSSSNQVYYAKKCSKVASNFCFTVSNSNSTCIGSIPPPSTYGWPGEKCKSVYDCSSHASKGCISGICVGSNEREACITSDDCNAGLRCLSNICVPLLTLGQSGCNDDFDCENSYGCDFNSDPEQNVCLPYYSVSDHFPIGFCPRNNVNPLCNSGVCIQNGAVAECLSKVKSTIYPKACSSQSDCASVPDPTYSNGSLIGECRCAYSNSTQSYCTLNPGDNPVVQRVNLIKQWIQSTSIDSCNTVRRFNLQCISQYWTKKQYNQYVFLLAQELYYPEQINSESCVQEVFLPDFYAAKALAGVQFDLKDKLV